MIKHVSFEAHDFSILNNRLDLLMDLRSHYPNFKVSLFTIPFDVQYELQIQRIYRDQALKIIKENLSWMQIIPHGLTHMRAEMETAH